MQDQLEAILVLCTIVGLFIAIYKNFLRPATAFILATLIFILFGIIEAKDVLAGFANENIASIILLMLITASIRQNFNVDSILDTVYKGATSYRKFLFIMMGKVAILSSFINNTPVVAAMTPYVFNWGRKRKIPPSKLLIPLSYATIMGGMITIIGTSTTLLLNGFLSDRGIATITSIDLLIIGSIVTVTGVLFITITANGLLPAHTNILEKYESEQHEYLLELGLKANSPLIGASISNAGLRQLEGLYLVEIVRANKSISPIAPDEIIKADDILLFAGDTSNIMDLINSDKGLKFPEHTLDQVTEQNIVESVISSSSTLLGKTVKESAFRNRYDAAVVGIHRNGARIKGKIGDIILHSGDLLLLFGGKQFFERVDLYRDLFVVSSRKQKNEKPPLKKLAILVIFVVIIGLLIYGRTTIFTSLLIIFSIMSVFKMTTLKDVKRELDLNLIAILILSLTIGTAMLNTDAGTLLSKPLITILQPFGSSWVLAGLMIITCTLTSFISNVAAVAIAFPIAFSISQGLNIDGAPFYLGIAFAASCSFLTPIGYQTNLIVYGPGGYTFKDFIKIGLPVSVVYLTISFFSILWLYKSIL